MRSHARMLFLTMVCGVLLAALVPGAAQAAGFEIGNFVATNCKVGHETCGQKAAPPGPYSEPLEKVTEEEAKNEGFTEAGGRVPFGITDFSVAPKEGSIAFGNAVPSGVVNHIRTDVAPGLATDPEAIPHCTSAQFGAEALPGSKLYEEPKCPVGTEIGENKVLVYIAPAKADVEIPTTPETNVYNLVQPEGLKEGEASSFGVALKLPVALTKGELEGEFALHPLPIGEFPGASKAEKEAEKAGTEKALEEKQYWAHTLIEGNVEWGTEAKGTGLGDFHDYFEINVSESLPLVRSRLIFKGTAGHDFITNATSCPGHNTTTLTLTDSEGATSRKTFTTPIGLEGCKGLAFGPEFSLTPASSLSDQPDAFTAEASEVQNPEARAPSQVKTASFTLPEGMTLNPSAAHGLEACTPSQANQVEGTEKFTEAFGVNCPAGSKIGTVTLNVPTLPDGSLTGSAYLGAPASGTITGPPYTMYVVANSERYRVSVRLIAQVIPNEATGQITTVFASPPEQPFSDLAIHFERSVLAPVANPLVCGTASGSATFQPTATPELASTTDAFGVAITGCAATIPFGLGQSTENEESKGGGHTSWTYSLGRPEGNQYLKQVKTTLPEGLVGNIPAVTLCPEAEANAGTCSSASKIGNVTVASGSGSSPYTFNGTVYMTGPYNGAPYGLSIVVPALAGPFNLGNVVSRATINVNPTTAQVTSDAILPTIVKGIPIRLRSLSVNINKQGFLDNPTNCSTPSTTESELTSAEGAVQKGLSSSFQLAGCSSLAFAPKFTAGTSAKTSRANGASITTTITQGAGQSNIKSVKVQLPKQLPSRLSTLNKACTEAVFNANPLSCPAASKVGTATVITPTLPGKMTGPAIFVSHGGAAFPDLDLVVEDQGVRVILVGNTNIKNNVTTTTFASTPDVPVTSVTVSLPTKSNSAVAAFGDLCARPLVMPTTITAQNGKVTKQNTVIAVSSCGVKVVGHKIIGNTAYLTVRTFAAGRISASGSGISTTMRSLAAAAKTATLKVPLSGSGRSKRKPLKVKIRVGFVPKKKGAHSTASVTVTFR
jgi:hypothetical protein